MLQNMKWKITEEVNDRIFVISYQRTGTTSTRKFLSDNGFPTCPNIISEKNAWSAKIFEGDYDGVFSDPQFIRFQAFQDHPWFFPEVYKHCFNRFAKSKFILLIRDPDEWFDSMVSLQNIEKKNRFSTSEIHAWAYRREEEYLSNLSCSKPLASLSEVSEKDLLRLRDHYKRVYIRRNKEVIRFFQRKDNTRLFVAHLDDEKKWSKLAKFIGVDNMAGNPHENKLKPM